MREKFCVMLEAKGVPSCQVSVTGLLWFAVDLAGAILFKSFMLNSSSCAYITEGNTNMNILCETVETFSYSGKFLLGT